MKHLFFTCLVLLFSCCICQAYDYYQTRPLYVMPNPVYDPNIYQVQQPSNSNLNFNPYNARYNNNNYDNRWIKQYEQQYQQKWERENEMQQVTDAINGINRYMRFGY